MFLKILSHFIRLDNAKFTQIAKKISEPDILEIFTRIRGNITTKAGKYFLHSDL